MTNMIIKLCSAFFFAYYFVEIAMIPGAIKKGFKMIPGSRIKPFDCVTCLSAWIAAALYFLPMEVSEFIFVMFGAGCIGSINWIQFIRDWMYIKINRK